MIHMHPSWVIMVYLRIAVFKKYFTLHTTWFKFTSGYLSRLVLQVLNLCYANKLAWVEYQQTHRKYNTLIVHV